MLPRRFGALLAALGAVGTGMAYGAAAEPPTREQKLAAQLTLERADHREDVTRVSRRARRLSRQLRAYRAGATPFDEDDTRTAARLVAAVVGWPEAGALRVAECESELKPWARNPKALSGSRATGSWQPLYNADARRSSTWHSTDVGRALPTIGDALNPYVNAFVAARVWQRNARTFREWKDFCAGLG